MQFIVTAYDGKDPQAYQRRLDARAAHLASAEAMYHSKTLLYAVAILDEQDKMIGSMLVVDFPSREALQTQWLDQEPYITGNVWASVEIERCATPAFCTRD